MPELKEDCMKKFLRRLVVTAVIGGMAANSVPAVSMLTVQAEETKEGITPEKMLYLCSE